jgi:hypothetical protein
MRNLARAIGLLTVFAFYPACGGSSDSGGSGGNSSGSAQVSSGLPPQTMVSDLTADQATQLCNAVATSTNRVITDEKYCTFFAVTQTLAPTGNGSFQLDATACDSAVQDCLSNGQSFASGSGCDSGQVADIASCNVTVQEFQACYTAKLQSASTLFGSLSCDRAPTTEEVSSFDPNAQPPECDGLDQKCPGVFGTSSGNDLTPSPTGCDDTCTGNTNDGFCDDGGPGSDTDFCGLGTDCSDCGARTPPM